VSHPGVVPAVSLLPRAPPYGSDAGRYDGEGELTLSDLVGGDPTEWRTTVAFSGSFDTQGGPADVDGSSVRLLPCR
jgi:hypothetical protein